MDNLDSLSDCSDSSRISSSLSTFSNLSEYQTEFLELKQLINSAGFTDKQSNISATNIVQWYEKQITNLNNRLQNSLKENEKYKSEIYNVGKQKHISYCDKIEKLLKQNKFLEENLLEANKQIERLISIYKKDETVKIAVLEERILSLEKTNQDLAKRNFDLVNDKNEIESDYKNLKTEINELKLELAAKNNTIVEFKSKVSEQHCRIEGVSQEKIKLAHSLGLISNELEYVKKSETWYKTELRRFQQERSNFSENHLKNEKIIATQEEKIEQLKLELSCLKCNYDEFKLAILKEKETVLKKLQKVELKIENPAVDFGDLKIHYESIISDLSNDLIKIQSDFEQQQKFLENISKEKSDYLAKYLSEKNEADEKQKYIETLEFNVEELKSKLSLILDRERQQNVELLNLRKTCETLKIELNSKKQDKIIFDESVNTIREQVKILMSKYTNLKTELQKRNQELLEVQQIKEKILLEESGEISELKRINNLKGLEIGELSEKIICLEAAKKNAEYEKNAQLNIIENLKNTVLKIQETQQNRDSISFIKLKNICKICKINVDIESITDSKYLLEKIQAHLESKASNRNATTKKLAAKIVKLTQKCKHLENKISENTNILKALLSSKSKSDETQHLQTQLQVKLQQEKDKQKCYERNYRTLLGKVKEHMRGREIAEKHNSYLQQLHDNLSTENSNLKLQLNSKDTQLDEYSQITTKLKSNLAKLEEKIDCKQCADYGKLQAKLKKLQDENGEFIRDNNKLNAKILELELNLEQEKSTNKQLRKNQDNINLANRNEIVKLEKQLSDFGEKHSHLLKDINHLNSCLQQKSEETNELHSRKNQSSFIFSQKENNLANLIQDLKKQILAFKSELDFVNNEKFFLQRLCNDLKIALKTQVAQNQALRNFIGKIYKEKFDCDEVLRNFPTPVKYDDVYIDRLLEENFDKYCDIDESLRALREEILFLQQQIVEKNYA